jgi:hypothetical protein
MAQEKPVNKQWQDQESWIQFTEKESGSGFKMSKRPIHHPVKPTSVLAPVYQTPTEAPEPAPEYILMPGSTPAPAATTHIETTVVPVIQPGGLSVPYLNIPGVGNNFWGSRRGYWGAGSYGVPYSSGLGGFGMYSNPRMMGFHTQSRVVQTGPSKSSGNYFSPATAAPGSSGNYYAPAVEAPRAVPVYRPEPNPKNYWGKPGSPLPEEQQPE